MQPFRVLIPARYNSSRLPGKPLIEIAGKPMIQHVYERALESDAIDVIIATDDKRILKTAKNFGATVCMTSSKHTSGSDRIAEAVVKLGYKNNDIIVNVQGDEPLIAPKVINQVANNLVIHGDIDTSTLCEKIGTTDELLNPNIVKVVMDHRGYALYFSRSSIPYNKQNNQVSMYYRHRGIYAYRVEFLLKYVTWDPCELEQMESLEQLRILWHGKRIHVAISKDKILPDVNTEKDLKEINKLLIDSSATLIL